MKPAEYWRRRSEEVAARQFAKADAYQKELAREYARAMEEIRRSIEVFYQRYAINGEVSMAEARRQLSGDELRRFKMTLEEFTEKAKNNADGRWTKQLNEVYYRVRVSRYEALLTEIQQQVEMLAGSQQKRMRRHLGDVYEDTYYRTIFEIQRGTGFGVTFAKVDQETLEKVLGTQFAGSNWSKRIWGDRDKLIGELRTKLAQAFIRGESAERTARELAERMGVSLSNAERLIQTETAFFVGEATAAAYKASGVVVRYEFLATLDSRTTEICRSMDGRVFALSEREVGVNYPPLHARCRSTVVPFFDDEEDVGERVARNEAGKVFFVPGDMSYKEWYNKLVKGESRPESPWSSIRSIDDLRKIVKDRWKLNALTVDEIPLEGMVRTFERMDMVFTRYPSLKGYLGEVSTDDYGVMAAAPSPDFQSAKVYFNPMYYKDLQQLEQAINRDVESGFHPAGITWADCGVHEMGHVVEAFLISRKYPGRPLQQKLVWNNSQLAEEIVQRAYERYSVELKAERKGVPSLRASIHKISGYAASNFSETIAEAFADYFANGENAQPLSKYIIRVIDEEMMTIGNS